MPRGRTGTTFRTLHDICVGERFNASWADGNDRVASLEGAFAECFNASWADGNDEEEEEDEEDEERFNASWADGNDGLLNVYHINDTVFQCLVGGRERPVEPSRTSTASMFQCLVGGRERHQLDINERSLIG